MHTNFPQRELFPELTDKQFYVLEKFALGLPIKSISHQMGIREDGVKTHFQAVRKKFKCSTLELRQIYLSRLLGLLLNNSNRINEVKGI